MRVTLDNLFPESDRALSRLHAKKIAEALGSKVQRETNLAIGEPPCAYKVPCHLDDFWCKAKVAETTIVFASNHKKNGQGVRFQSCFSLSPWRVMITDTEVVGSQSLIGQSVFRQQWIDNEPILQCLNDPDVRSQLRAIVAEGITFLVCSGSQILAEFDSKDASISVRRIRAFQSLQLALYNFSQSS